MSPYPLLDQFLSEECGSFVIEKIQELIENDLDGVRTLNFNRFELTVNSLKNTALLEDVLDASEGGSVTLGLDELRSILKSQEQ